MKLIECYVENFGSLKNFSYSFSEGLNVIREDNGFGKTTLSVFIKSMLFGLDDTKRPKIEENDRKHYTPWQGGRFGGSLTFSHGDRTYRIERTFMPKASDDTFTLYDCESGKVSEDFSKNLGEELFGIDADGFERTVFLSERKLSTKNENKKISAKLSDLVGVDGDVGELDKATAALEERRKYYYKRGGSGKIADTRDAIARADAEITDLTKKQNTLAEKKERLSLLASEINTVRVHIEKITNAEKTENQRRLYLKKKEERDRVELELLSVRKFFEKKTPTQAEISDAERNAILCADIARRIDSSATKENSDALLRDLTEAEGLIASLESKKCEGQKEKKIYPAAFICTALTAAVGALLGAFVALPLFLVILIGIIPLAIGFKNLSAHKGASHTDENGESAAIDFIKKHGYKDGGDVYASLLEIKATLKAEIKAKNEANAREESEREELSRLKKRTEEFLSYFQTETDEPLREIKDNLARLDRLTENLRQTDTDLATLKNGLGDAAENGALDFSPEAMAKHNEELKRLQSEYTLLEREYKSTLLESERIDELSELRAELSDKLDYQNERLRIINLTKEHLVRAKDTLTAKYLGKTREAFKKYADLIICDDPELFTMDTSFALLRSEGGDSKPTEAYSLGTRELFSLAMRLSLIDSLYEKEYPFIMLDDPFAHFDDKRTALGLKLISKIAEEKQIIYFTCSEARTDSANIS